MTSALRILEDLLVAENKKLPSRFYTYEDVTIIEKEIANLKQTKNTFCAFLQKIEEDFCHGCEDGCDICNEYDDENDYLNSLYKVNKLIVHNFDKDIDRLKSEHDPHLHHKGYGTTTYPIPWRNSQSIPHVSIPTRTSSFASNGMASTLPASARSAD